MPKKIDGRKTKGQTEVTEPVVLTEVELVDTVAGVGFDVWCEDKKLFRGSGSPLANLRK